MPRRFDIEDDRGDQSFSGIELGSCGDSILLKCNRHPIRNFEDFTGRTYVLTDHDSGESVDNCWIKSWDAMDDVFRFQYSGGREVF